MGKTVTPGAPRVQVLIVDDPSAQESAGNERESGLPVVDLRGALERFDADIELLVFSVEALPEQIAADRRAIASAARAGEPEELRKASHRLKGVLGLMGASLAPHAPLSS